MSPPGTGGQDTPSIALIFHRQLRCVLEVTNLSPPPGLDVFTVVSASQLVPTPNGRPKTIIWVYDFPGTALEMGHTAAHTQLSNIYRALRFQLQLNAEMWNWRKNILIAHVFQATLDRFSIISASTEQKNLKKVYRLLRWKARLPFLDKIPVLRQCESVVAQGHMEDYWAGDCFVPGPQVSYTTRATSHKGLALGPKRPLGP